MRNHKKQHEYYSYETFQKDLSNIHASEELKNKTKNYISKKANSKANHPIFSSLSLFRSTPVFASLCLFLLLGSGAFLSYRIPVTTISVDVNPSLELKVNTWDYVVDVKAYNEDAQKIMKNLTLTNISTDHAIETLLSTPSFSKHLKEDADLTFTIVSKDEDQYTEQLSELFSKSENKNIVILQSDEDTLKEAHEHHFSVGKYHAYKELTSHDDSIELEDCRHMTMHEIHCAIHNHSDEKEDVDSGRFSDSKHHEETEKAEEIKDTDKHESEHESKSGHHRHHEK